MFPWTKPYDLEALYEAWKDAPVFDGKSPKPEKGRFDIDTWLDKIEEGCSSRKVPKDLWHKVAQHYLGKNACSRFLEVEKVLTNLHGGRFTWTWKTFRKALASIRCKSDPLTASYSSDRLRNYRGYRHFQDAVVPTCSIHF